MSTLIAFFVLFFHMITTPAAIPQGKQVNGKVTVAVEKITFYPKVSQKPTKVYFYPGTFSLR